jgi:hypothetical protein
MNLEPLAAHAPSAAGLTAAWWWPFVVLAVCVGLLGLAAWLFRRQFARGQRI